MSEKNISIVVPCFNEQESVGIFHGALTDVMANINNPYEIIFVDDGSKDSTLSILESICEKDKHATYISFSRNFGKESAMYAGFCNAKGDYVAVMDADMQDSPSLLPEMIEILDGVEYDSVATRRVTRKGEPVIRSFFARRFYKIINRISDADVVDGARDFRLMKRDMVDAIIEMNEYNRFTKGIFGWIGFKTYWLPFENVERVAGETKWSFWKLFKYSIDGIINFSQVPLAISSACGVFFTLLSFFMIIFIICKKIIIGDSVQGWASIACIIIFMGGILLFCIGIMGQYVSKIYLESKHRPHYIMRKTNRENVKKVN